MFYLPNHLKKRLNGINNNFTPFLCSKLNIYQIEYPFLVELARCDRTFWEESLQNQNELNNSEIIFKLLWELGSKYLQFKVNPFVETENTLF